jgi:membrane-associated PAP2 superfamily phosphatase
MAMTRREMLGVAVGAAGIVLALALLAPGGIDEHVQWLFYDGATGAWIFPQRDGLWRPLLYTGPKVVLAGIGVALGAVFVASFYRASLRRFRPTMIYLIACLALVPLAANGLKGVTNIACPSQLAPFGGDIPHVGLFDPYPPGKAQERHYRCWPAGHASGGFALLSLGFLGVWRRVWVGFVPGMAVGWIMGLYQMAKGVHFLSHTLVTMFGALLICALLSPLTRRLAHRLGAAPLGEVGDEPARQRKPTGR